MKKLQDQLEEMGLKKQMEKRLRQDYMQALNDPDFRKMVDKVDAPDDLVMKFTSKLQDCVKDYKHCKNCKGLLSCKNQVTGYYLSPIHQNHLIEATYLPCRYQQRYLKDTAYQKNVHLYEVPLALKEASMKNIHIDGSNRVEVIKWMKQFLTNYPNDPHQKGLYLHGNFGCGKTYLISALFNKLAESGYRSAIVYYPEFLRSLKASFSNPESDFETRFHFIKHVPLLLIDDIGAETTTPWSRDEILGSILQYRMDQKLPTFFTSNISIKDIEGHFAVSLSLIHI